MFQDVGFNQFIDEFVCVVTVLVIQYFYEIASTVCLVAFVEDFVLESACPAL